MAKVWIDDFNRADGALTGSTLSGGGATWANAGDEDIATVTSNRCRFAAMTNGFNSIALVDTAADTDDLFVQVSLPTFTRPGNSVLAWRLYVGVNSDASSGYMCRFQTDGTTPELLIRALLADVDLVVQADVVTSGVLTYQRVGGLHSFRHNGVVVISPFADATEPTEPTGASNRFVGIGESWDDDGGGGTRLVEFDSFTGGDVVKVPVLQASSRRRRV